MAGTTTYFGISYPTSTDLVKDGAANMQTIATGFDSAVAIPVYNNQTGTTYTFALSDIGKTVTASNAGASTYTIPPTASVTWPANTTLLVTNLGAGVVTFAGGAGVTVTNTAATLSQYQSAHLVRTGLNAWTVIKLGGSATGLTLINTTSFSAVASQNFPSVFSSTYDNYEIVFTISGSTSALAACRVSSGASPITTATYNGKRIYSGTNSTAINQASISAGTYFELGDITSSAQAGFVAGSMTVNSPFLTTRTAFSGLCRSATTGDVFLAIFAGENSNNTSYDGFALTCNTGTITGSASVYGYNK